MSQVDDSFLDDDFGTQEPETEVAEPVEAQEAEPEKEPEKKVEEPEKQVEKEEPDGETTAPEKQEWTLKAVLDEREKRQKWEQKAKELEEKLKESEPKESVSVFDDEQKFVEQERQRVAQELRNTALNMSQAFAEESFGEDVVAEAAEWFKEHGVKSPYAVEQFNNAKLPYHTIVKLFKEEQERQNPDALRAKIKAEILAELKQSEKAPPEPDTPSLATSRASNSVKEAVEDLEDILGD